MDALKEDLGRDWFVEISIHTQKMKHRIPSKPNSSPNANNPGIIGNLVVDISFTR